jgi:hypothetical protein
LNEIANAEEHIIRSQAARLGIGCDQDDEKAKKDLDKALGHTYRAFFDIADFISSMILRKKIREILAPYSTSAIQAVIPDYYSTIRPRLEDTSKEIAKIRGSKDIAKGNNILNEVIEYESAIETIFYDYQAIIKKIPALEEYKQKEAEESKAQDHRQIKYIITGALIGAIATAVIGLMWSYFS